MESPQGIQMQIPGGNEMSNELKAHTHIDYSLHDLVNMKFYLAADVDALLAEKDKEIESLKASHYAEMVDAGMRERRLRRALWLAHAYKAKFKRWWLHLAMDYESSMISPNTKTINRIRGKIRNCEKSERKCRAMAERYGEGKV
jgi:Tat protein secretion system quality control protein TatD with DNase activity